MNVGEFITTDVVGMLQVYPAPAERIVLKRPILTTGDTVPAPPTVCINLSSQGENEFPAQVSSFGFLPANKTIHQVPVEYHK